MFDPMSWLCFWKPRLRNRSVLVATLVWLLSVAGSFTGPADASVITLSEIHKLTASDRAAGDNFGISVAVSGTTAVIGAFEDDVGIANSGSAYVFLPAISVATSGDFNRDEAVDATDIDLLREAIHANDTSPHFDVNEDSFVNSTDLDYLVEAILGTVQGDGDLNKIVNFQDFALLSTNFSAIDSGWAQGNFNMDSRTDFMDFVALANNYGIDLSSGVSAQETVPEPASLVLLSLAFSFVAKRRA